MRAVAVQWICKNRSGFFTTILVTRDYGSVSSRDLFFFYHALHDDADGPLQEIQMPQPEGARKVAKSCRT